MTSICRRELDKFVSKVESSGIPQYDYVSRFIWKETRTFHPDYRQICFGLVPTSQIFLKHSAELQV